MRIRTTREVLATALDKVGGVVERRQTLPILSNFMLAAKRGKLVITGTDLEVEIRTTIEVMTEADGESTIPARKFTDICRALPSGSEISLSLEGERAVLRAGRSRFTLSTLPAKDFPASEGNSADYGFSIKSRELRQLLEKTAFAMGRQDVRYYLNGMLLEVREGKLNAVATDGHRLAQASRDVDFECEESVQIIVPRKTVLELVRQLGEQDEVVQVGISSRFIRVSMGNTVITSKLIDGRYPDYERVIPRSGGIIATIDRESLRQALVRTAILSNEKFKGVRLSFDSSLLRLKAHNPEQEEAVEELSIGYEYEPVTIGFNVDYLLDVLGVIGEDNVGMRITDGNSSVVVVEGGKQVNTFVIMPMRL